ncbi:MAG: septum formation protein Maf [Tenericutes bacterium]|nr:septum formation protein Maf [Mycoplasmatota bacterium]
MKRIILASNSPRRKGLMKYLDYDYEIIASNVEELIDPKLEHEDLVMDLAFQKAYAIFKENKDAIVLGFDTLVIVDDYILGKPKNKEEAKIFLKILSNRTHKVMTGCSILTKGYSKAFHTEALVSFVKLSEEEIDAYIKTGESMDKAGAYGIQGYGAKFVQGVSGDYFTIVGFPIARLYQELKKIINQ